MAYDYNNYKKFYEAMNESQRAKWTESNKNDADFKDFYSRYTSSTPTTNTAKNQTSNSTNWSNTTYKDSDGYYSATDRNAATGGAEFGSTTTPKTTTNNSNATRVSGTTPTTTTTTPTTTPTTTTNSDKIGIIRDGWNQLTYEQQQEKLKATPGLKENLVRYGITSKTNPATDSLRYGEGQYKYNPATGYYEKVGQRTQGGNETPTNKGGWDYQDNSPERTAEIIRNLDDLSKSNPGLFSDYDTFYNAFIAGKGRSPEQEKVLNDYFNKMKQYNKYDNMSSDELGYLLAHGEPAEDYLSYLKYNDPQRYAEIQESRKKNENQIMNETYLNTVASQAGYDMSDSDFWKWNQEEMGYRDVNKDGLDDRLYHAPTEEELKLVDENNQYEQERAKLTDAYKWLQEDLTNQYPDADLSTIMLLTSDRGNKIQRALDTLAVNQTKVQGSLKYLQNERATMDDAGQKTINEIQKQYGMYYDYSPQGIAERAQAEYAATNVTLDQADNGTDTQKQMALDTVLTPIYEQYGDIIQRPKAQVINDIMAYASKNGLTLSQALDENFMKYLKEKPEYQNRVNAKQAPEITRIGTDADGNPVYGYRDGDKWVQAGYSYNSDNGTFGLSAGAGSAGGDLTNRETRKATMREIAEQSGSLENAAKNIASTMEGTYLGINTCGKYVNDYIYGVTGTQGTFGDLISEKPVDNTDLTGAKVGDVIVFDWNINPPSWADADNKKYGHVGIITGFNPSDGSLQVSSTINGKVTTKTIKPGDDWYSNIKGTKSVGYNAGINSYGYGENPMSEQIAAMRNSGDLNADQKKDLLFASQAYGIMYDLASSGDIEHLLTSDDGQKFLANLKNAKFVKNGDDATGGQVMDAIKNGITDQRNLKTVNDLIAVIELKLRKTSGAAIAASEWVSNFDMLLPSVNQDYDVSKHKYERFENTYLREYFNSAGAGVKGYKYRDLFGPNSPYYSYGDNNESGDNKTQTNTNTWNNLGGTTYQNTRDTAKGTWKTQGTTASNTNQNGGQFDSLFSYIWSN